LPQQKKENEFKIIEVEWTNSYEIEWHPKTKFKDKKLNKWHSKTKKKKVKNISSS